MCTYATVRTDLQASAKGPEGSWFHVTDGTVYFDHPVHNMAAEHTINIDFANPADGPSARVAVELTAASARELMTAIQAALDSAPRGAHRLNIEPDASENSVALASLRLLIVAGKGGVGRSTVAAAIALAAARQGRRTLVAELAGRADVARLLGAEPGPGLDEVRLGRDLYHVSIDREAALRDYLDHEVPGPLPARRLTRSRTFALLIDATPGMGELLSIGKVWELAGKRRRRAEARAYDLVVLDGPASGQLMALLRAPHTFGAIARVGPVARQTRDIDKMLTDPAQTGVVLVAAPEQMAVTEVVGLRRELRSEGVAVDQVVVNRTVASPFSRADLKILAGAGGDDPALSSARWLRDRAGAQRQQLSRLTRGLGDLPQIKLPFLFGGIDRHVIEDLATRLTGGEP